MRKDDLIKNFNKILLKDPYILNLCNMLGIELDSLEELGAKIVRNTFFDSLDEDLGIPIYAKTLDITFREGLTTEEKNSIIQAKWKSKGKCDADLIQSVCNSWKAGEVSVDFVNSLIRIGFKSLAGIPSDVDALKKALDKVKPAYLLVDYIFNYLYWDLWDSWNMTWDYVDSKNLTWDNYEITIVKP